MKKEKKKKNKRLFYCNKCYYIVEINEEMWYNIYKGWIDSMKNMYAVKCLYKYSYYNQENELIEEVIPSWEERIILIKADNMDDADKKSIIFAPNPSSA